MREEYAIIESLSREFDVRTMCEVAGVSRSGFYKWRGRAGRPPGDRAKVLKAVRRCHEEHPSHGYRWVHAYLSRSGEIHAWRPRTKAEIHRPCLLFPREHEKSVYET